MLRFVESLRAPVEVKLDATELGAITASMRLALDAIYHINETGEALGGREWAGPERWGSDPEGVGEWEHGLIVDVLERLAAIEESGTRERANLLSMTRSRERECPDCDGDGEICFNPSPSYPADPQLDQSARCHRCNGKGIIYDKDL